MELKRSRSGLPAILEEAILTPKLYGSSVGAWAVVQRQPKPSPKKAQSLSPQVLMWRSGWNQKIKQAAAMRNYMNRQTEIIK